MQKGVLGEQQHVLGQPKDRTLTGGIIKRKILQATHGEDKSHRIIDIARAATPIVKANASL